ncbi:MAG: hypothetical protein PF637_11575 [Spirochaetes bacterium]|jgi:rRNA maturation endonuclease Nob1|nr:hypothetical protein [Spirochaetota bacterium]
MEKNIYMYICESCKKMSHVKKDDPIPHCCGQLMVRYTSSKPAEKDSKESPDN